MTPHCRRCEFVETEEEPLAVHAIGSGHPLCICCHRSLTEHEPQVCEDCLQATQQTLSAVVTLYGDLPNHLGHLHGWNPQQGHSSDGAPLVGGTVLVMLGPAGQGTSARRLTTRERAQQPRWWLKGSVGPLTKTAALLVNLEQSGREHAVDNLDRDGFSVSGVLGSWALDWQDTRGESLFLGRTPTRIALKAAGYLETKMRWAATQHPAFDDFVTELRGLLTALERVTAHDVPVQRADADCFDCGGTLIRSTVVVAVEQEIDGRKQVRVGPVPTEVEEWVCQGCKRSYDEDAYRFACAAVAEANLTWVSIREASRRAQVPFRTVQTWATREQVQVDWQDGRRCVWWPEIRERAKELKEAS